MKRVHFFTGQLLNAADFQAEQDYHLDKVRQLNLRTHGVGVVSGLDVSVQPGSVSISPGFAIDPLGNEITVETSQVLPFPASGAPSRVVVALTYTEIDTDPVPVIGGEDGVMQPTRIEESFQLEYLPPPSAGAGNHIELAWLTRINGTWNLEPRPGSLLKVIFTLFGLALLLRLLLPCSRSRTPVV